MADEPGIIVTFEQFPEQLYQDGLNFGCVRACGAAAALRGEERGRTTSNLARVPGQVEAVVVGTFYWRA